MKTYTVDEAARYCHCHPETLREYIRAGQLIASKVGRAYCIRQVKLDEFLAQLENNAIQASPIQRSEALCQSPKIQASIKENPMALGILTSAQAVDELDALLAQPIRQKRKRTVYS